VGACLTVPIVEDILSISEKIAEVFLLDNIDSALCRQQAHIELALLNA